MTEAHFQEQSTDSVGEILKKLRQEQGLGVQEVATRLHLDPGIVEALETDAWEQLPASIYVRGYIRNYAKLLGADSEALIRVYDQSGLDEEPEIIPEVRHGTQTSSSDKPVKAFTYLLTLVLVILLVAWWQSNFMIGEGGTPTSTQEAESNGHRTVAPAFDYHFNVVNNPTDPFYRSPTGKHPEPGPEGGSAAGGQAPAAAAPENHGPAQAGKVITTDSTGPDTLHFKLSADSWIEVYDAGHKKVYVDLARAGDTIILHGTAPFSVLLGFAQGVSVKFDGKPFDPAPYSRSGVARFTLGKKESNQSSGD